MATADVASVVSVPSEERRGLTVLGKLRRFAGELGEAVVQAWASLVGHRLRALLTILGVATGIMVVVAIAAVLHGFTESFMKQLSALGPNTIYVTARPWMVNGNQFWRYRNRPAVGQFDWRALQSNATLPESIAPTAATQATVGDRIKELKNVEVRGTTEAFLEAGGWQLKRGRFISQIDHELGSDACVIGADIEDAFFKDRDPLGEQLKVGPSTRCTVVGTLVRKGNAFGRSQDVLVLLPLSSFLRSFGAKRGLVIAVVAPPGKVSETEDEVIAVMRAARRLQPEQEDNFSVNRQDKLVQGFNQMTMALNIVSILVGLITVIVGGIGIMNISLVSVKERTREIGVRRALGARRNTILLQFLCEAIVVSLAGGVCGVAMGAGAAALVDLLSPLAAVTSPQIALAGVLGSALLGATFGLWPALSAALLQPIEALRYE